MHINVSAFHQTPAVSSPSSLVFMHFMLLTQCQGISLKGVSPLLFFKPCVKMKPT